MRTQILSYAGVSPLILIAEPFNLPDVSQQLLSSYSCLKKETRFLLSDVLHQERELF